METINIFSAEFHTILNTPIRNVLLENNTVENCDNSPIRQESPTKGDNLSCSYCQTKFPSLQQQREHFKLDWHRYNIKQSLLSRPSVSEQLFTEKTDKDDLSSISGSDSEENDNLDTYATAQGKIFLQNSSGRVFSLYRCLLVDKKEEITDTRLLDRLNACCKANKRWCVLMLGGGHFAGAVFDGNDVIVHKTFHCYTVRAGQGGSQSSRDNKSGGSHPKSAGASLRRYNEQALVQHVQDIVTQWDAELKRCCRIFYRASGPYNRSVLFGGGSPPLRREDERLRTIPFSTRRGTFAEVKRVQSLLSSAHIYGSLETAVSNFTKQKQPERQSKQHINRAKSRERVERPLPGQLSTDSSNENVTKQFVELDIDLDSSLNEFEDSLSPAQRKRAPGKKKATKKSRTQKLKEKEENRRREIVDVLTRGDVEKLKELLENVVNVAETEDAKKEKADEFINEAIEPEGMNTLLHLAAMNEHGGLVEFLLANNANPTLKNKSQQTGYSCTQSKEIREIFKQFAKDNPEKYNYNKAHIPTTTLSPEEIAEKKKAQRKVKREKEKEKQKENKIKQQKRQEKERFLQLSDREKRALAAERRILNQAGTVTAGCFLCGADMAGKTPFEYFNNRFCTIECLKAHRLQNITHVL